MTTNAAHYTYRVRWSPEDNEFVATVAELPSLSWLAESQIEALTGLIVLVEETLADMKATGEQAPIPYADRSYSGRFMVRVPPEAHRRLAIEASEQNVSLNRLVSDRLSAV